MKTTSAKQTQTVRITSERQLDDAGVGGLFLYVVQVDERDVAQDPEAPSLTLPGLIEQIRGRLQGEPAALEFFELRLVDRGWLSHRADLYSNRRWTVRRETVYRIDVGFPRITEAILPSGVGDVAYALSLSACSPFEVPLGSVLQLLNSTK